MSTKAIYLFACDDDECNESPASAFYCVEDESVAAALCRLCTQTFTGSNGHPAFTFKSAASIPADDQILMDESLQWLQVYDDPDAGVYDPQPTQGTLFRAQYAIRAERWGSIVRKRITSQTQLPSGRSSNAARVSHADHTAPLVDFPGKKLDTSERGNGGLRARFRRCSRSQQSCIGVARKARNGGKLTWPKTSKELPPVLGQR